MVGMEKHSNSLIILYMKTVICFRPYLNRSLKIMNANKLNLLGLSLFLILSTPSKAEDSLYYQYYQRRVPTTITQQYTSVNFYTVHIEADRIKERELRERELTASVCSICEIMRSANETALSILKRER